MNAKNCKYNKYGQLYVNSLKTDFRKLYDHIVSIANYNRKSVRVITDIDTVSGLFCWDDTVEGHQFWNNVENGLFESARRLQPHLFPDAIITLNDVTF